VSKGKRKKCVCVYYCRTYYEACVCLLLQDLVQSCVRGEGGDIGGHVLRETTSRGLCGLVCPSRTSERGGEGDCVVWKKEGEEKGSCLCLLCVCVFITSAVPIIKLFAWGGG
jgi:hypothetical protein